MNFQESNVFEHKRAQQAPHQVKKNSAHLCHVLFGDSSDRLKTNLFPSQFIFPSKISDCPADPPPLPPHFLHLFLVCFCVTCLREKVLLSSIPPERQAIASAGIDRLEALSIVAASATSLVPVDPSLVSSPGSRWSLASQQVVPSTHRFSVYFEDKTTTRCVVVILYSYYE